jgi:hypothetical protein
LSHKHRSASVAQETGSCDVDGGSALQQLQGWRRISAANSVEVPLDEETERCEVCRPLETAGNNWKSILRIATSADTESNILREYFAFTLRMVDS